MEDPKPVPAPQPNPFPTLAFLTVGLIAFVLLTAKSSWTAETDTCGSAPLSQVHYTATFKWKRDYRIQVGSTPTPSGKPELVAEIYAVDSEGKRAQCNAVCRAKSFEQDSPLLPVALQMNCYDPGFRSMSTETALIWASTSEPVPVIRFGSWLKGYQQFPLSVQMDDYSLQGKRLQNLAKR